VKTDFTGDEMTKERHDMFVNNSISGDEKCPIPKGEELTEAERLEGYHYCWDWDELFVGPGDKEAECCTCFSAKEV